MAAPTIKIKRSAVSGNAPTTAQLELGELALNTYDGKLFTEINTGSPSIVEIGSNLSTLSVSGTAAFAGAANFSGGLVAGGLTYPTSDGSNNQSLVTNGSGTLSWSTIAGGTNTYTTKQTTTATEGQTAITVSANYTSGFVDVYLNGVRLVNGASNDFVATNGTSIVLNAGASAGDILNVVSFGTFSLASIL